MFTKLKKNLSSISFNNIENKRNNIELKLSSELNNKLSLECSYLINEIKRKNKTILIPLQPEQKRLNLKRFEQLSDKIAKPKILDNSSKSLSSSSLFNLPKVKTRNKININQKVVKNNNFSLDLHKKIFDDKKYRINRKFFGIQYYMKDKYYSDIENDLKSKIQTKYFRNDSTVKKEIIAIKKFESFWKKMINYCEPIIIYKKYQLLKKNSEKNNGVRRIKMIKSNSSLNS